jgi:hypothetical protein
VNVVFLAVAAATTIGCTSIQPNAVPRLTRTGGPRFDAVSVSGMGVTERRLTGQSSFFGSSAAYATGSFQASSPSVNAWGRSSATASSVLGGGAQTYDYVDSGRFLELLRTRIEDAGIARRVVPEAPVEIRGMFMDMEKTTGAWNIWNFATGLTLVTFFGAPEVGSREATVELRLYRDGELVQVVEGKGGCSGHAPYWDVAQGIQRLESCAVANAVEQAVVRLADGR